MGERLGVLSAKFGSREVRIVERLAARQHITVSQYIRGAVMASTVLDGDAEAMKLMAGYLVKDLAEKASRLMREGKLSPEPA